MWNKIALSILFSVNLTLCSVFSQEKAQDKTEINSNDSILAVFYETNALTYKYTKPDSSRFFLEKALYITRENDFKEMEATILNKIGGSLYILGEYDLALDYFNSGFKVFKEINHHKGIAVGYNNIGMIYNIQGRTSKAISYHKKSLGICRLINDSVLMATNLFNLGISYDQIKDYDSALISSNKAIIISKLQKTDNQTFMIYNLKGRIYTNMRLFDPAEEMFMKIINAADYNNLWEISYAHSGLASLYQVQQLYKKSILHGKTAFELAKKLNAKWDIQASSEILSISFSENNQFDSAYKYLYISKIYSDSIFNKEKENHINYINLKNAEYQNEKLLSEKNIQEQLIDKKNLQILFFIIGFALLISLLIIIINNNKQKQKLNQKLKSQNNEINQKNKELERLISTKDLIFRVIAHDLLSPLSTIVAYTDFIISKKEEFNIDEILELIEKFNISSNQAYNLLENLLEWAKSQMGETKILFNELSVIEIVNRASSIYNTVFTSKNIQFTININNDLTIYANKNMISTVLRNLIANAIKFTAEGGAIEVRAFSKDDKIEIVVEDNGVGIEETDLQKILDSKPSHTTAGTAGEKGSGLGLVLCKEFVENMNGDIWVKSTLNNGSSFHFSLPANKPAN